MMCLEVWYIPGKYLCGESGTASKLPSTSKVNFLLPYLPVSKLHIHTSASYYLVRNKKTAQRINAENVHTADEL